MSTPRLENGNFSTHIAPWYNTGTANKSGTYVGENTPVEIRHDHHVKLLGPGNGLHGRVVDDHIIDLQGWIVLRCFVESVSEQAVGKLHDIRLVYAGDFLTVVGQGKAEGELCYPL